MVSKFIKMLSSKYFIHGLRSNPANLSYRMNNRGNILKYLLLICLLLTIDQLSIASCCPFTCNCGCCSTGSNDGCCRFTCNCACCSTGIKAVNANERRARQQSTNLPAKSGRHTGTPQT